MTRHGRRAPLPVERFWSRRESNPGLASVQTKIYVCSGLLVLDRLRVSHRHDHGHTAELSRPFPLLFRIGDQPILWPEHWSPWAGD